MSRPTAFDLQERRVREERRERRKRLERIPELERVGPHTWSFRLDELTKMECRVADAIEFCSNLVEQDEEMVEAAIQELQSRE
jgi:hypothetical protein